MRWPVRAAAERRPPGRGRNQKRRAATKEWGSRSLGISTACLSPNGNSRSSTLGSLLGSAGVSFKILRCARRGGTKLLLQCVREQLVREDATLLTRDSSLTQRLSVERNGR